MCKLKLDPLQRQWFLGPAVMSVFALTTGVCPGQLMICKRREWFKPRKEK